MENPGAANTSNPLSDQARPEQPMGAQQGNPLARLAPPMGGQPQPMPAPTKAQTVAATQRFSAIQAAMRAVMSLPDFGKSNVRPQIMNEASKLLGSKLLSLPQIMEAVKDLPDSPLEQKQFVTGIFNNARQAEASVLDHHGAAIVAGKLPQDGGDQYDADQHEQLMDGLLSHYRKG